MAQDSVTVAGDTMTIEVAQTCIGRHCSAPADRWEPDVSRVVDVDPESLRFYASGYRSYDCVPAAPGRHLEIIDVLVAAGQGAGMQGGTVDGVLGILHELNDSLQRLPDPTPNLWELTPDQLFADDGLAAYAGPMWTAAALLMNVQGVTILTTHAILHHKFPTLFPLLDRRTIGRFSRRSEALRETHADLRRDAAAWAILEDWHRDTIVPRLRIPGAVPLTRVRLHALLLDARTT